MEIIVAEGCGAGTRKPVHFFLLHPSDLTSNEIYHHKQVSPLQTPCDLYSPPLVISYHPASMHGRRSALYRFFPIYMTFGGYAGILYGKTIAYSHNLSVNCRFVTKESPIVLQMSILTGKVALTQMA